jgi:hypothetical protein
VKLESKICPAVGLLADGQQVYLSLWTGFMKMVFAPIWMEWLYHHD